MLTIFSPQPATERDWAKAATLIRRFKMPSTSLKSESESRGKLAQIKSAAPSAADASASMICGAILAADSSLPEATSRQSSQRDPRPKSRRLTSAARFTELSLEKGPSSDL
jgi:hypothetical protein